MKNSVKVSPKEIAKQVANNKRKTVETRVINKAKNSAKKAPVKAKKDGIVYLNEGVTAKQFLKAKQETNNAVKQHRSSISQCIGDAYEQDKGFFESINLSKTALKKLIRPENLLNHATNSQLIQYSNSLAKLGYIRFNVWYTLNYIKAELDGRKVNNNAVLFFAANRVGDKAGMTKAINAATTAIAKAKKATTKK